ncbi:MULTISPECIES: transcriptional regulator [unclassified Halorhabdus]|uniref:HVO_A0114 family putative DNA-binding protein n=1 Tax=unclassified Halorhabdus TaxID=2621901 RepID=UPI0023DAA908|nr:MULTISPECIES: transcriptional regulator [unclassified Halorhabdus]WEL16788.1 Transcriptional regulator, contains HTH domain [Halorhabdus sp. SVX81]WEL20660.1 Transcriptional regulator, contains HTH domain [Halorhabdus sp. BNX81]
MATTGNDTDRTLHVRFREGDDEQLSDTLAALDRGETPDPHLEVVYTDPADVHSVTRPKSLELLRAIVQHEPGSIRETARLVERDVSQVHRNLTELSELHLIDLVEEGHAKRPVVWYDAIDIDLPLVASASDSDEAVV